MRRKASADRRCEISWDQNRGRDSSGMLSDSLSTCNKGLTVKHILRFFLPLAVAFCLMLAPPMSADVMAADASSKEKAGKKSSSAQPHKSKATAQKAKSEKKVLSENRKDRSKKTASRSARKKKSAAGDSNRDLWLKRAQDSEIMTGIASWYGGKAHGGPTASGLHYDMYTFTAAHRTLPMGTIVRVTDQENGKSVMVCVTDRGPYINGRIIDLSYAAARQLDLADSRGIGKVALEVVSDAEGTPLREDQAYFVRYTTERRSEKVGPFRAFVDAAAMHEALRQVHPEAEVVLDSSR